MTEQIVFYGKGGVGKSTLMAHVSAALVEAGFRVLQIGCDSKADSCTLLNGGFPIPTIRQLYLQNGTITYDTVIQRGYKGVSCIELGGRLVTRESQSAVETFELLSRSSLIEKLSPDFVLFDISGEDFSDEAHITLQQAGISLAFIVTTADYASLATANSIVQSLEHIGGASVPVPFGGLIANGIASAFEESFVADFARQIKTRTLGKIPRSLTVRQCELYGKTVIEASPLSNQSYFYRRLANQIVDQSQSTAVKRQPEPLSREQMRLWANEWGDRLFALENGLVMDGAAI